MLFHACRPLQHLFLRKIFSWNDIGYTKRSFCQCSRYITNDCVQAACPINISPISNEHTMLSSNRCRNGKHTRSCPAECTRTTNKQHPDRPDERCGKGIAEKN